MKKCPCRFKIVYIVVLLAVFALASFIVMYLINSIISTGFLGLTAGISYCTAAGILLLSRILFGRWKIRKCMSSMCGCGCGCGCSDKKDECCDKKDEPTTCTTEK